MRRPRRDASASVCSRCGLPRATIRPWLRRITGRQTCAPDSSQRPQPAFRAAPSVQLSGTWKPAISHSSRPSPASASSLPRQYRSKRMRRPCSTQSASARSWLAASRRRSGATRTTGASKASSRRCQGACTSSSARRAAASSCDQGGAEFRQARAAAAFHDHHRDAQGLFAVAQQTPGRAVGHAGLPARRRQAPRRQPTPSATGAGANHRPLPAGGRSPSSSAGGGSSARYVAGGDIFDPVKTDYNIADLMQKPP